MTATLVQPRQLSADEFYDLYAGREGRHELVRGEVISMPPVGPGHGRLDRRFARIFGGYVEDHGLGEVFLNTGFILDPNPPALVRGPDEAFVSVARMAENPPRERGFYRVIPEIAVEIISPEDTARDLREKVHDYLRYGVSVVWVVRPEARQVEEHRPGQPVRVYAEQEVLTCPDLLPGFEFPLGKLWIS